MESEHFAVYSNRDTTLGTFPFSVLCRKLRLPGAVSQVNSMWRAITYVSTHLLIMDDLWCVARNLSFLHFPCLLISSQGPLPLIILKASPQHWLNQYFTAAFHVIPLFFVKGIWTSADTRTHEPKKLISVLCKRCSTGQLPDTCCL